MVQTISFPGQGELKYRTLLLLLPLAHSQLMMGPISLSPSIFWLPSKGRCTSSGAMLYLIFMNYFISTDIKTFTQVLQKKKKRRNNVVRKTSSWKHVYPCVCVPGSCIYCIIRKWRVWCHMTILIMSKKWFFFPRGLSNNIISKVIAGLFKMMSKKNKWNCLT